MTGINLWLFVLWQLQSVGCPDHWLPKLKSKEHEILSPLWPFCHLCPAPPKKNLRVSSQSTSSPFDCAMKAGMAVIVSAFSTWCWCPWYTQRRSNQNLWWSSVLRAHCFFSSHVSGKNTRNFSCKRFTRPFSKLTIAGWNIPIFNRKYIFKVSMFHCYVRLPACTKTIQNPQKKSCNFDGTEWPSWPNLGMTFLQGVLISPCAGV